MAYIYGKMETALHVLNRVSKIVDYDEILDNVFPKCLNRVTALHVKFYSSSIATPLVSVTLINHIIARSILPKFYGGLEKIVYLFEMSGNFRMLKLVAVLERMIRVRNTLLPDAEVEIIVKESLSRLLVAQCISIGEKALFMKTISRKLANLTLADINHFCLFDRFEAFHEFEIAKVCNS